MKSVHACKRAYENDSKRSICHQIVVMLCEAQHLHLDLLQFPFPLCYVTRRASPTGIVRITVIKRPVRVVEVERVLLSRARLGNLSRPWQQRTFRVSLKFRVCDVPKCAKVHTRTKCSGVCGWVCILRRCACTCGATSDGMRSSA